MSVAFAKYLAEKGKFTQTELKLINDASVTKRVRKNQYLLEEGEINNFRGFVVQGSFRVFRIGDDGQEHVMSFAIENWWVSDCASFLSGLPSNCYIEALENSELLWFAKDKWNHLLDTIPNFKRMIDMLGAKNFEAHQNRIFSNISETAEVRYDNFVKKYPGIYNRIPLYMIASFLGLTRETLSRIRKQIVKAPQAAV